MCPSLTCPSLTLVRPVISSVSNGMIFSRGAGAVNESVELLSATRWLVETGIVCLDDNRCVTPAYEATIFAVLVLEVAYRLAEFQRRDLFLETRCYLFRSQSRQLL